MNAKLQGIIDRANGMKQKLAVGQVVPITPEQALKDIEDLGKCVLTLRETTAVLMARLAGANAKPKREYLAAIDENLGKLITGDLRDGGPTALTVVS